ncbi:MAG: hypothetical protein COB67_12425 [SAR324 cluster bacterium]|uniref:Oligopeptide transport permease C-like N-terminal domain-containing protein n=1 Tax=SAR324 cluster bacterium TaxID=2024889 RepID=A0A2A4SSY3_9DELT|nr:MAG: hypothetical protein COB67_12425 [SAR324 cluster bacterium]
MNANSNASSAQPEEQIIIKGESLTKLAYLRFKKNKMAMGSLIFIVVVILMAAFAPLVAPSHYADGNFMDQYIAPGENFLMGSDILGRDVFSRLIYGARISLSMAIIGAFTSFIIGVCYGLVSGFFGGKVDEWMMRVVDILYRTWSQPSNSQLGSYD